MMGKKKKKLDGKVGARALQTVDLFKTDFAGVMRVKLDGGAFLAVGSHVNVTGCWNQTAVVMGTTTDGYVYLDMSPLT